MSLCSAFLSFRSHATSMAQGYHLHLRLLLSPLSKSALPRWIDQLVSHFNFRWSVRAMVSPCQPKHAAQDEACR